MPPLDPNGGPVPVGQVILRTPGLSGEANELPTDGPQMRGATLTTQQLEDALAAHGILRTQVIEISGTQLQPAPAAITRGTRFDGEAIELEVPDLGPNAGQLVLATDEGNITTWHLPRDRDGKQTLTRGGGPTRTFLIKRAVAVPPPEGTARGPVGTLGTKLLQILVFPLVDPIIGKVAETYARHWEERNRPYQLRSFRSSEYTQPAAAPLSTAAVSAMAAQGPVLLFVHGTFARAHRVFDSVPAATMAELDRRYEGRLVALDHYTVSDDPLANARWFAKAIPSGTKLVLDILSHSRGGLVARSIAEQIPQEALGPNISVRHLVFAGSPNAGCVLADPEYMVHLADRYTNWVKFLPSSGALDILEGVVAVVKQLAVAGMKGLVGLESMVPGGAFLHVLNTPGATRPMRYHAFASNYEPADPNLQAFAHNALMDAIFRSDNDLVVPTAGVYQATAPNFPIAGNDLILYSATDGVDHGGYFSKDDSQQRLLAWLPGGAASG